MLVPEGRLGLTFWGRFENLGLMPYFLKVIELSPSSHQSATTEQGDTQHAIDGMLATVGFEVLERGTVNVVNEWPDTSTAVQRSRQPGRRCLRSSRSGTKSSASTSPK